MKTGKDRLHQGYWQALTLARGKTPFKTTTETKLMKSALWAIPFLAGCSSMLADYNLNNRENGSGIYTITDMYGGDRRPRELAVQFLDTYARNICNSEYTIMDEVTRPVMNRLGEVRVSYLTWKIKCDGKIGESPP